MDIIHINCCKIVLCLIKKPENKRKRGRGRPIFKNDAFFIGLKEPPVLCKSKKGYESVKQKRLFLT